MKQLFTSSGYSPFDILALDNGVELNLAQLPPFLRVLLITDGTVTKSLESYFWEPVTVHKVAQSRLQLKADLPSLGKVVGDEVISRQVSLVGEKSGREYATAVSYVRPEILPDSICRDLELDKVGIGELLRECGLETYRELISLGCEGAGDERVGKPTLISRTYRIVMDKKPFIQITEQFPLSEYQD